MANQPNNNIHIVISRCVNQLLIKEPFYAHVAFGTTRIITSKIPTAAVGVDDNRILLMFNEDFFLKQLTTQSQRVAVLKHEILHLVFKHLFRELIKKDPELMNLAADIVVNQYIGSWDLPDTAVTLSTFPELELKAGETMEYYYARLEELKEQDLVQRDCSQVGSAQSGACMNGRDLSGSGMKGADLSGSKSMEAFKRLYGNERHSDHSQWIQPSSDDQMYALNGGIDKALMNAADRVNPSSYGLIPGDIRRRLDEIRENRVPKLDWKRQLRLFASSKGRSYIFHTMKRVSKRYGTRPGIRIRRKNRVAVVIDTSGSINEKTLELFIAEIEGIFRTGAEIIIIESDAEVQNVYPFKRGVNLTLKGGGGTAFDPAFKYINTGKSGAFDVCIYLTDGFAGEPYIKPRCSLLWVLDPTGQKGPHLKWGPSIQIKH